MTPQRFASGRFGGVARLPGHQVGRVISNLFGGGSAQELLDSAPFCSELLYTAIPQRAASGTTATFTRATTKTIENNDGYLVTLLAGEIGFPGARRVHNRVVNSEDFTAWTPNGTVSIDSDAVVGPDGITLADTISFSGASAQVLNLANRTYIAGNKYRYSVWAKVTAGTKNFRFKINDGATDIYSSDIPVTTEWVRYSALLTAGASTTSGNDSIGIDSAATAADISFFGAQLEDVTAQTTQTAGEYVSVGVESAPYYHGSFVDGVKCFPTDLAGNALPTQYTYDAVTLNGQSGTYVSTPDSVASSITGDIDIRAKAAATDWTPSTGYLNFISKFNVASVYLALRSSGNLFLNWYQADGTQRSAESTAGVSFTNGVAGYTRATLDVDDGAGNCVVTFYTSIDGIVWEQLGTAVTQAFTTNIRDTVDPWEIGSRSLGTSGNWAGKIYRVQIYNGINGTLAVDFDASRYAGGTTLTGSAGETWTLQGNAVIHPTNNPMLGYLAEGARTNYQPNSNAFTTSWVSSGAGVSLAQNAVDDDGATTAWTATITGAGQYITYATTGIAADQICTLSINLWPVDAGTTRIAVYNTTGGAQFNADCDPSTGTITATSSSVGASVLSTSVTPIAGGGYRFSVTGNTAGGGVQTNNPVIYYGDGVDVKQSKVQFEIGSFASSYIATTTAAVTRNADVLTYSSAGNIDGTKGWCYAEVTSSAPNSEQAIYLAGTGAGGYVAYHDSDGALKLFDAAAARSLIAEPHPVSIPTNFAVSWGGSSSQGSVNGAVGSAQGFDGGISLAGADLGVGGNAAGIGQIFGTIRNVRIGQRQLSASELQAITS